MSVQVAEGLPPGLNAAFEAVIDVASIGVDAAVQSLWAALGAVAEGQRALQARVLVLEAVAPELPQQAPQSEPEPVPVPEPDMEPESVPEPLELELLLAADSSESVQGLAHRLQSLERSVEEQMAESLERDMGQSEEMLAWDDEVSSLGVRLKLLESSAVAVPAAADAGADNAALVVEQQLAAAVGAAPKTTAASMLQRLADVELRVAATEVTSRSQHVELEAKVDLHAVKLDELFAVQNALGTPPNGDMVNGLILQPAVSAADKAQQAQKGRSVAAVAQPPEGTVDPGEPEGGAPGQMAKPAGVGRPEVTADAASPVRVAVREMISC